MFDFTEDQLLFRDAVREFAARRLSPGYLDRARSPEFPWKQYREAAKLGVAGIGIAEEYGGTGQPDFISLGIACEELAYGDINVAVDPYQAGLSGDIIQRFASPPVKQRYLPVVVAGEVVLALALTEPESGSDAAAAMRATARKVDGGYVLALGREDVRHPCCATPWLPSCTAGLAAAHAAAG